MVEEKMRPELHQIEREYQRDVAVVSARPKLLQAGILLWTLVDVALIVFFVVNVILYLISGSFAEQREIASIGANAGVARTASVARIPESLVADDVKILTRGEGIYDLYATVENPNEDWIASITYTIQTGEGDKTAEAVVLPGETKYLLHLNYEGARPSGAELVMSDVQWDRIDRHEVPDIAAFLVEHGDFVVESASHTADVAVQQESISRSVFKVKNNTPYSYYRPAFVVLLKKGGTVIGINNVTVPQFIAGETRDVEVHWFGSVPSSGTAELIPEINYFDEDAYSDPDGTTVNDLRNEL